MEVGRAGRSTSICILSQKVNACMNFVFVLDLSKYYQVVFSLVETGVF